MQKRSSLPPWPIALLSILWRFTLIVWVVVSIPAQVAVSTGDRYDPTRSWPAYFIWWQVATIALVALTRIGAPVAVVRGMLLWRHRRCA